MTVTPMEIGLGLLWFVVLTVSVTFHEASHGFAALKFGDTTAYTAGLVTLDPIPHMQRSPIGMIVVPILSFALGGWMIGWASTPYDPYWAHRNRRQAALMALAGPAANLILILLAALLIRGGMLLGVFAQPDQISWARTTAATAPGVATGAAILVSVLFSLNLILLVFNLLPVPPLDGSEVISLFLSDSAAERYREFMAQPYASIIGLIVAWNVMDFLLRPEHTVALNLLYPGAGYH
ncbi:MAG: site-2 protease family protein [Planctomycetaceae bacterium]|nr:MAG: site-2 protease family protein [Planctomycetaceae bacterium]